MEGKLKYFGVKKGNKYLKGSSYVGGRGGQMYKFSWTKNKSEALRYLETSSEPDRLAEMTHGKIVTLTH